jgi:hypothetical protein
VPDLDAALKQFDRVASTLEKAERVWTDLDTEQLSNEEHEQRVRQFVDLTAALPGIEGFVVTADPMRKNEISLARWEAIEVDEPEFHLQTEERIAEPGAQLRHYRHLFNAARRDIVRARIGEVVELLDATTAALRRRVDAEETATAEEWRNLDLLVSELDRLLGDSPTRSGRWSDLRRHTHFAEPVDLHDIVENDWPSIRMGLDDYLYDEFEPLPVDVGDLAHLVAARPRGPVSTALNWSVLDATAFERLLFDLVSNEDSYENADWLMRTNAADAGRDVQVHRVTVDPLSGTQRSRVIVQCKHWTNNTIGRDELVMLVEAVRLWEPPRIDVLIVATTGRFSRDAVTWHEQRELERAVPRIELWPDSHLEMLLARRPHLVASYGLR